MLNRLRSAREWLGAKGAVKGSGASNVNKSYPFRQVAEPINNIVIILSL